ncbi:MAG: hypothetical protein PHC52_11425 [Syntrophales bacterium]|nr:hypothetical protein [Syntrophales bacterium]
MQAIAPLTLADFTAAVVSLKNKIELYYSGSWQTPEAIISDSGGKLLVSVSTSLGGSDPQRTVMAGSWSAEIYNPAAIFHPLHPTSTYKDVFTIGRKVRISAGLKVSGTDYLWPVMCGIISRVEFDTISSRIRLTGYDYAQVLADYTLRPLVDLNFGGTREFTLADGSNVVSNGSFDVDITGWTAYNGLVSSNASGYSGKCLEVATDDEIEDRLGYQRGKAVLSGLVVGGKYQYSFRSAKGTQNWKKVAFVVGSAEDYSDVYYQQFRVPDDGWGEFSGEFIAPASTLYIALEKSSPHPAAAGSMLFDELTIHQVQNRAYPMTTTEYPTDPAAKGCFLLRLEASAGPPAVYEDYFVNEDFTWDRDTSTFNFVPDWEMPAAGTDFIAYVYEAWAPEDVIFEILANAGLYADAAAAEADAVFTATGIEIDRVGFEAGTSGLEAIRMIAERCSYQFYFRYDGKPVFQPKPAIKADGLEDLELTEPLISQPQYIKNDKEFYNRILLAGELQDRESKDDLGDKAELQAEASDAASIAAYGEKSLSIKNTLWQDQATIDAAAADMLAELKTAKAYLKHGLNICPLPIEMGDTIRALIRLVPSSKIGGEYGIAEYGVDDYGDGGILVTLRGLVRDIKLTDFDLAVTLELEA